MRHRIDTDTDTFYMYIYIHTYIAPPKKKTGSIYHCFRYEVHQVLFVFFELLYIYTWYFSLQQFMKHPTVHGI